MKCDVECLTLVNTMTTYLIRWKMHEHYVNPFTAPLARKWFPFILNSVLENLLVCTQLSSKLAHLT